MKKLTSIFSHSSMFAMLLLFFVLLIGIDKSDAQICTGTPAPGNTISTAVSVCSGQSFTLSLQNATPGPGVTHQWQTAPDIYTAWTDFGASLPTQTTTQTSAMWYRCLVSCAGGGSAFSNPVEVTLNPNPVVTITGNTTFCQGGSTTFSTGYCGDYIWSTGATTQSITVNAAGTYTVTVSNCNSCTGTNSVNVTMNPLPDATITGNTTFCQGGSTILSAPIGMSAYQWSTGATLRIITVSSAGAVAVTVTDGNSCTATNSVNVTMNPLPVTAITGITSICTGGSTTLTALPPSMAGYQWSTGATTQSITVNFPNPYTVTATNSFGCTASATTSVSASTAPPTTNITSLSTPAFVCTGQVHLLTATNIVGQNIQYLWNGMGTVQFSTNATGPFYAPPFYTATRTVYAQFGALSGAGTNHNISVQAVNGCGTTTIYNKAIKGKATAPSSISGSAVACPSDVGNYSCTPVSGITTYIWTFGASISPITLGQGTNSIQVTFPNPFTSGQLCVTTQLACGASSASVPRCKTISNNPALPGTITGPVKVCPGETGVVYSITPVSGATGYGWILPPGCTITSGANTNSIQVTFPSPYVSGSVCVTANSNCGSSTARCITVGSHIPKQPGVITGTTYGACNTTLNYSIAPVAGATSYNWIAPAGCTISAGQGTENVSVTFPALFTSAPISVTANTNLCAPGTSVPRTLTIYGKPTTPGNVVTIPVVFYIGTQVNFSVSASTPLPTYTWTVPPGCTLVAGQGSNNIDVTWGVAAGTIKVNASNSCGVSGIRSQSFIATPLRESQNLYPHNQVEAPLSVYPNQVKDNLNISVASDITDAYLKIFNMNGQLVYESNGVQLKANEPFQISMAALPNGIYMLHAILDRNKFTKRFVKN